MPWKFFTKDGAEKRIPTSIVNPMVKAYSTAATSIPNTTLTVIPLEVEEYDTDGMHDTAANNSRITIQHAGTYLFVASISWASNATGLREVLFRKNGVATYFGESILGAVSGSFTSATVSTTLVLNAGDYIELIGYQNSGGSLALGISAGYAAWMSATKIDGAVVSYVGVPGSLVGQELAYAEKTTDTTITATVRASSNNVVTTPGVTFDGSTPVIIEVYTLNLVKGTNWCYGVIFEDSTPISDVMYSTSGGTVIGRLRRTPSAGSHTYSFRGYVDAGSGSISGTAGAPAFIRITRAA